MLLSQLTELQGLTAIVGPIGVARWTETFYVQDETQGPGMTRSQQQPSYQQLQRSLDVAQQVAGFYE